jgi:hypothetical protein
MRPNFYGTGRNLHYWGLAILVQRTVKLQCVIENIAVARQLSAVLVCTEITGFDKRFGNFEQLRSLNFTSELHQKRYLYVSPAIFLMQCFSVA